MVEMTKDEETALVERLLVILRERRDDFTDEQFEILQNVAMTLIGIQAMGSVVRFAYRFMWICGWILLVYAAWRSGTLSKLDLPPWP